MRYVLPLSEVTPADEGVAGAKAFGLSRLALLGFPVPSGFVVLATAFDDFLKENALLLESPHVAAALQGDSGAICTLQEQIASAPVPPLISDEIRTAFDNLGTPTVAVRSSATGAASEDSSHVSWAGIFLSELDVDGGGLLESVKRCWASFFEAAAAAYRRRMGINDGGAMAVIVQEMLRSEVSGVATSCDVTAGHRDTVVIYASWGLAQAQLDGSVTPDRYTVEKDAIGIRDRHVQDQHDALISLASGKLRWRSLRADQKERPKLRDEAILRLALDTQQLECEFGRPIEVEWSFGPSGFSFLQCRPITTLEHSTRHQPQFTDFTAKRSWKRLYDRPWNLFACSLHARGYACPTMAQVLGGTLPDQVYVERQRRSVSIYRPEDQQSDFDASFERRLHGEPAAILEALLHAVDVRDTVEVHVKKGPASFPQLQDAVLFCDEVVVYTMALTRFAGTTAAASPELRDHFEISQQIRTSSPFYDFQEKVVAPLAAMVLQRAGIPHPEDAVGFFTIREILAGQFDALSDRRAAADAGWGFVYQRLGTDEEISWRANPAALTLDLQGPDPLSRLIPQRELRGEPSSPGTVTGVARVVLDIDVDPTSFTDGEVLVSVNGHHRLSPLMARARALVSDEGGAMCHASVLAREFNIPAVTGTHNGTRVITTGSRVEVNGTEGIVRLLGSPPQEADPLDSQT